MLTRKGCVLPELATDGDGMAIGIDSVMDGIDILGALASARLAGLEAADEDDDGGDANDNCIGDAALDDATAFMRVVSSDEGDVVPKRFPIAASKLLSSSGSVTGVGWVSALFVPATGALEKKSSIASRTRRVQEISGSVL